MVGTWVTWGDAPMVAMVVSMSRVLGVEHLSENLALAH